MRKVIGPKDSAVVALHYEAASSPTAPPPECEVGSDMRRLRDQLVQGPLARAFPRVDRQTGAGRYPPRIA